MTHSDTPRNNGPTGRDVPDLDKDLQPDRTDFDRVQDMLGPRYQLNWIIGRGGMSTVWLARDTEAQRDVAVKILKPEYTENEEFRTRFRNEASAAEQLNSPNVVATYDYGEVRDRGAVFCYIIMEYVSGESLADVLTRERVLPESLVLDIIAQTARGLQAIHATGMVHRDIKPGNLLITSDGVVKVTDLGIAKAAAAVPLTRTGMVVGTAQYVSPEQAQGNSVGPASDIYSLGVVGYEILAGERPFAGESTVSVAIKHISEDPRPLPETVSQNMRELIGICLRKNPDARYADGEELAAATVLVSEGQRPPQPHRVPAVEDFGDHPLTEQLGAVAHGPGTRVPPMQGPAMDAAGPQNSPVASRRHPGPNNSQPPQGFAAAGTKGGRPANTSNQRPVSQKSGKAPVVILGLLAALAVGVAGYLLVNNSDDKAPGTQTRTITSRVTPPGNSEGNSQPNDSQPGLPEKGNNQGDNWFGGNRGDNNNERPTDTTAPGQDGDSQQPTSQPENSEPTRAPGSPSQPGEGENSNAPGNQSNSNGVQNGNGNSGNGNQGNSNPRTGGGIGGNTQANGGGNPGPGTDSTSGEGNTNSPGGVRETGQLADHANTPHQVQPTATVAKGTDAFGQQAPPVQMMQFI